MDLEKLVKELASEIENNSRKAIGIARTVDKNTHRYQKQRLKNQLMNELGYDTKSQIMASKLEVMTGTILYLNDLGIEDIGKVANRAPAVISCYKHNVEARVRYLKSLGVDVKKVVYKQPSVLAYGINSMKQRVNYLKKLGVVKHLAQVINNLPPLLGLKIEQIDKNVNYLRSLGVVDFDRAVRRMPAVLELDIKKMRKRVKYLRSLGINDFKKVVTNCSQVFGFSQENVESKVKILKSLGFKKEYFGKILTRQPQILGFDIDNNIKPTYRFLHRYFKAGPEDIVRNPELLGLSLEARMKPRYIFMKNKKKKYKASTVLKCSDEEFCNKHMKCPVSEYQIFKKKYLNNH